MLEIFLMNLSRTNMLSKFGTNLKTITLLERKQDFLKAIVTLTFSNALIALISLNKGLPS